MKRTVFARVVAKPISFPDEIQIICHELSDDGTLTGNTFAFSKNFNWDDVMTRYYVPTSYREEATGYLLAGESANLGNKHIEIDQ